MFIPHLLATICLHKEFGSHVTNKRPKYDNYSLAAAKKTELVYSNLHDDSKNKEIRHKKSPAEAELFSW